MRRCQRIGCENSLDGLRKDARYCGSTCRREAGRARAFSGPESWGGFDWLRYARVRRNPSLARARKASTVLSLLAAIFLLAGCGGATKTVTVAPRGLAISHAPVCRTMNCVLAGQPPPNVNLKAAAPPVAWGLDFAYGSVSAAGARGQGAQFGASYLSVDAGKNWTRANIDAYHAAGLSTVAVWETVATRAGEGCAAGAADAHQAAAQLAALGAPARQPFTLAIDFDASGPDVAPYFHCASQAEPGRVNAYGGYRPLAYLHQHGDVGNLNWQTYAWSGGLWLPASVAPLEQYLNGSVFDHDRAIAADYGQWGGPAPVARVNHHYRRYPIARRKVCHCSERAVVRSYDRLRAKQTAQHHPHRAELRTLRHDAGVLAGRIYTIAERCCLGDFNQGKPHWNVYHRRQRYDGLRRRAHGGIVPRPHK